MTSFAVLLQVQETEVTQLSLRDNLFDLFSFTLDYFNIFLKFSNVGEVTKVTLES